MPRAELRSSSLKQRFRDSLRLLRRLRRAPLALALARDALAGREATAQSELLSKLLKAHSTHF